MKNEDSTLSFLNLILDIDVYEQALNFNSSPQKSLNPELKH